MLGARDADIGQTALLFELFIIGEGTAVREDAFFHPDDEHNRELQTFGAVHRHEHNSVLLFLAFSLSSVSISAIKRQIGQEGNEGLVLITFLEVHRHGQELLDIFETSLGFNRILALHLQTVL